MNKNRTVRELGGEIWSEIDFYLGSKGMDWRLASEITNVVMGVLARRINHIIVNDEDLPVQALPQRFESSE